ncbi:MAG: hypothetical protein ACK55I_33280, partial [bacterium]
MAAGARRGPVGPGGRRRSGRCGAGGVRRPPGGRGGGGRLTRSGRVPFHGSPNRVRDRGLRG